MSAQQPLGRLKAVTVYADSEIRKEDGGLVAVIPHYRHDVAMRLAACWNACEGLSTEALERLGTLDRARVELDVVRVQVAQHRAKMVEAIRELIEAEREYRQARGGPWVYKNVPHQIQHRLQLAWQSVHNVIGKD